MTGLPTQQAMAAAPLAIAVFGMGLGESVLLRFETDDGPEWAVVDSARKKADGVSVNPALEVLRAAGARPAVVILTHPHHDHAKGMADLVRRAAPGARIGCVEPLMEDEEELKAILLDDDRLANDVGQTTTAHAAISTAWRQGDARRLTLEAEADNFDLFGWTVDVLHPPRAGAEQAAEEARNNGDPNLNNVSVALTLTRDRVSLLLAGDGEKDAWDDVSARLGGRHLRASHPLKVPHHGSRAALQAIVVDPTDPVEREQVVTPFPGSGRLPRFGPGEGAERLIQAGGSIRLTAMPASLVPTTSSVSLAQALEAMPVGSFAGEDDEIPTVRLRPPGTPAFGAAERDPRECWVLLGVEPGGGVVVGLGDHAVTVA
jgi:beta-lactamase superfamily II metal-dependent hydrolase